MITRAAFFGGATRTALGTPATGLSVLCRVSKVWTLAGVDATCFFQLEDARNLKKGQVLYLISESFAYAVKDASGAILFTTTANTICKGFLIDNSTQAGVWRWRKPPVLPTVAVAPSFRLRADLGVYDNNAGGSLISVDGTAIGRWEDQSANALHVIQATAGFRPLWKANILNGLPVVRWDGSDDALGRTPFNVTDLSGGGSEDQITIFSVHKVTTAQNQRILSCDDGGNRLAIEPAYGDSKIHFYVDSTSNLNVSTPGGYVGSWRTDTYLRNGTSAVIRSNGSQIASGSVSSAGFGGAGALSVGGFNAGFENFAGDEAELIVYPAFLGSTDYLAIEAYLRDYFAHY